MAICLSMYPPIWPIRLSVCHVYLFIISVYLSIVSVSLSILSVHLPTLLSICPSVCPVYLSTVSVSLDLLLALFLWRALSTTPPLQPWAEGAWMDQ